MKLAAQQAMEDDSGEQKPDDQSGVEGEKGGEAVVTFVFANLDEENKGDFGIAEKEESGKGAKKDEREVFFFSSP